MCISGVLRLNKEYSGEAEETVKAVTAKILNCIPDSERQCPNWQSWLDQRCAASTHEPQKHQARHSKRRIACQLSRTATWSYRSFHMRSTVDRRPLQAAIATCARMRMTISWRTTWQWLVREWSGGQGGMSRSRRKPRFAEPRRYVLSDWSVHINV